MRRWPGSWVVCGLAAALTCCLGLAFVSFDFSGERVLYATAIDGYSIRLVRRPPEDFFEHTSLVGDISTGGRRTGDPFWMGSLYDGVAFSEYRFPEEGVLLVYDRDTPDSILVGIDAKNGLLWPDRRTESDPMHDAGRRLVEGVNRRHGTSFHIAAFHCVKRWR
ncbi:hypothetical protein [Gemmata sp.]|uniref:hypothetical protein n=1 Tax=Gemmata sp. TaxID=1914242 RepID=UPI003F7022D6